MRASRSPAVRHASTWADAEARSWPTCQPAAAAQRRPSPILTSSGVGGGPAARWATPRLRLVVSLFSTPSRPALRAAACGGRPRPATRRPGLGELALAATELLREAA
jgi:hypothetical protein